MIEFSNVTKTYNSNIGIENVSVKINQGDFVFLVGPSGAGKSTFIKLILKEINPDSGSIKIKGREITKTYRNSAETSVWCFRISDCSPKRQSMRT